VTVRILQGDCRDVLKALPAESVHCCVTSPPYFGLRDYGVNGQIGLEPTPDAYVAELVAVFREIRRVLRNDGTLWLNLGDSYAGSSRGGNPESGTKQGTNKGSQSVGVRYGMEPEMAARERVRIKEQLNALTTSGLKPKDLIGIPWRVAFALQADGWWLRQDIIWSKPNPMPESVTDRCTKAHEYIFLLSKSERYYYDAEAIAEPFADDRNGNPGAYKGKRGQAGIAGEGRNSLNKRNSCVEGWNIDGAKSGRNKRSVWEIPTQPYSEAHFATFPPALVEPCILAGCPKDGTVLDPFGGAGTTGLLADRLQRNAILIELNPEYAAITERRLTSDAPLFADVISEE
jgi:DNA modification methylase